ncbi:hypothetical protein GNI_088280, partial [Gregarina niphandrodes]
MAPRGKGQTLNVFENTADITDLSVEHSRDARGVPGRREGGEGRRREAEPELGDWGRAPRANFAQRSGGYGGSASSRFGGDRTGGSSFGGDRAGGSSFYGSREGGAFSREGGREGGFARNNTFGREPERNVFGTREGLGRSATAGGEGDELPARWRRGASTTTAATSSGGVGLRAKLANVLANVDDDKARAPAAPVAPSEAAKPAAAPTAAPWRKPDSRRGSAEKLAEKSAEKPTEKLAEKPAEKLAEKPAVPAATPADKPRRRDLTALMEAKPREEKRTLGARMERAAPATKTSEDYWEAHRQEERRE